MKQKTTIILALAAVAVAGLAVAARTGVKAVVPAITVTSGASATIAVTGATANQPNGHAANDFPASISPGSPQTFSLKTPGQVVYTQGSSSCSYIIADAGSNQLAITTSANKGQLTCDASFGGQYGTQQVTFSITSSSA